MPFDGAPRFAEVEAYDLALKEGGDVFTLIRHLAPAAVNGRLKPATPFTLEPHTRLDEDTSLGVLAIVEAIRETLNGPKVTAALAKLTGTPSR
ncbi:hypothetical protein RDMS_01550 [Deinococcus sp. RL]|uniref:hypothetical protein n=1 Tax=Deinococcus sp. RL TaxID=1489678 RepID=UPI0004D7CD42|nr:hypothetical protein [Deinococcus sp. RL]KEF35466.1 hypothetical protein RDMS_01550 [Deinococcus sp. RL]